MTAPPGGPYGQDPYGSNPYGQQPYWGGPPQGDPYQQYPPPGGPYTNPPGGTDPGAGAGYPPQQYAQPPQQYSQPGVEYPPPGQQYPPPGQEYPQGWPTGPYPPGPPPNKPRSKMPWLIVAGIAVLGIIALVVILVVAKGDDHKSTTATSSSIAPTTSEPDTSQQIATGCTANVSGGEKPSAGTALAGKLSFPTNAAPGWQVISDEESPNLIGAVGVSQIVPGGTQWLMQAEIAVTNFVPSMDVGTQASKLLECFVSGPGYSSANPTLGPTKTSSPTVDGTKAARVDADISIADASKGVKGDSVTIIAIDTKPVTIFFGASPIGDAASAAIISQVIAALKVAK
jgi:hypothetical protein